MFDRVALVRGINVGGRNTVSMSDLRAIFATLGFAETRSVLQSGNVLFTGDGRTGAELERALEAQTERHLNLRVAYLVRTAAEWAHIVRGNPFPNEAQDDPGHLVVMCLKHAPDAKSIAALAATIEGPERVRAGQRDAYLVYPAGIGRSKLTTAAIETQLGSGTGRNWNTVLKLFALLHP